MFTLTNNDNIELRNIQEQVQKNKEDIANHYAIDRSLANFGIKIVGTVSTPESLPNPLTYVGEYGDGYAVGEPGNYVYYIFTRPDPNSGQFDDYWLNVGSISIVGPEGPQGPQGEKGDTGSSTKWYTGAYQPSNPNVGDMYLNNQGQVYQYSANNVWVPTSNIIGPQGIQGIQGIQGVPGPVGPVGPKGDRGDVGGFINIWGTLSNTNQLPSPSSLNNLTVAYLVEHTGGTDNVNDHYDLYIQVGETSETAIWTNAGPFNAATLVTVNGLGQNVWDADVKADKSELENFIDKNDFNLENGSGQGSLQQKMYPDDTKNPTATGLGAIALGGHKADAFTEEGLTATSAEGVQSFAQGGSCHAYGPWSVAMGAKCKAYNNGSVAIGAWCEAGDPNDTPTAYNRSFACGAGNYAIGKGSFVCGEENQALGAQNMVGGYQNIAQGSRSSTLGWKNIANCAWETVVGKYNNTDATDTLFCVGYGWADNARYNAIEVNTSGEVLIPKAPTKANQAARKQDITDAINAMKQSLPKMHNIYVDLIYGEGQIEAKFYLQVLAPASAPATVTNLDELGQLLFASNNRSGATAIPVIGVNSVGNTLKGIYSMNNVGLSGLRCTQDSEGAGLNSVNISEQTRLKQIRDTVVAI